MTFFCQEHESVDIFLCSKEKEAKSLDGGKSFKFDAQKPDELLQS